MKVPHFLMVFSTPILKFKRSLLRFYVEEIQSKNYDGKFGIIKPVVIISIIANLLHHSMKSKTLQLEDLKCQIKVTEYQDVNLHFELIHFKKLKAWLSIFNQDSELILTLQQTTQPQMENQLTRGHYTTSILICLKPLTHTSMRF